MVIYDGNWIRCGSSGVMMVKTSSPIVTGLECRKENHVKELLLKHVQRMKLKWLLQMPERESCSMDEPLTFHQVTLVGTKEEENADWSRKEQENELLSYKQLRTIKQRLMHAK